MAKHPYPLPTSDTVSRRTFLSKSALTVGSLTTAGLLLDACGSTASTNTGTGHRTLNVMYDSADTLIGKQLLSQFEQENNCTVSVTKFDQIRLNASLASGSPPDIVRSAGASEMPNLIARGLAENLDPYFAKSTVFKADDLDPVTGVYRFDGKKQGQGPIYGLPIDFSQDAMIWYNKALFDKAGVPHLSETDPISYDDLLTLGKKLTTRNGDKIQVYGLDATWNFVNQAHLIQMVAQQ
ncbi:MAG TPA: extracellular solute-binding protein, partial [Ktedonobacteraceae bacterium]|nr:extracellular solute-binding protein [Ktedonobacteraceae bacterium]